MVTQLEQRTLLAGAATVTALSVSSPSLRYGQNETFTAAVVPLALNGTTPTGSVTFMEGSITLGTVELGSGTAPPGTATFNTTELLAGNDAVTAVYSGQAGEFARSSSAANNSTVISTVAGGGLPANRQALYTTLSDPEAVAVDSSGNLFIADSNENEVKEVNATTGAVTIVAGDGTSGYSAADPGEVLQATAAELDFPEGVAVEGSGSTENSSSPIPSIM